MLIRETLKRFVAVLYDRTSTKKRVNEAREKLFAQRGRGLDALPPIPTALKQHTMRPIHQAGYYWGQLNETEARPAYVSSSN